MRRLNVSTRREELARTMYEARPAVVFGDGPVRELTFDQARDQGWLEDEFAYADALLAAGLAASRPSVDIVMVHEVWCKWFPASRGPWSPQLATRMGQALGELGMRVTQATSIRELVW